MHFMELQVSFHPSANCAKGNIHLLYFNNRQGCMNTHMLVGTLANNLPARTDSDKR